MDFERRTQFKAIGFDFSELRCKNTFGHQKVLFERETLLLTSCIS